MRCSFLTRAERLCGSPHTSLIGDALGTAIANRFGRAVLLGVSVLMRASITANTAPLQIVAIGASNTHGWYVGNQGAYPAQLQALLEPGASTLRLQCRRTRLTRRG